MSSSSSTSNKTPLIVSLENPSEDMKSYQTIRVSCGDEYLDIELRRTLRLPSDDSIRSAPAGYGCFPIYLTDQYAPKSPKLAKGGAFIPIYRMFLLLENTWSKLSSSKNVLTDLNAL
jgi:hypothetical protein